MSNPTIGGSFHEQVREAFSRNPRATRIALEVGIESLEASFGGLDEALAAVPQDAKLTIGEFRLMLSTVLKRTQERVKLEIS